MAFCEKTGVQFEARSVRQKNHPAIMSIINEATRHGWYREAIAKLDSLKGHYASIEPYIEALREVEAQYKQAKSDRIHKYVKDETHAKEGRRARFVTNDFLRTNGYRWSDLGFDDEEEIDNAYTGATPRHDWQLFSSDGRAVTLEEAMQELAAVGKSFAKEWLAERNIAEVVPAIILKRQAEAKAEAEKAIRLQAIAQEQAEYEQELIEKLIKLGFSEKDARERAKRLSGPHHYEEDYIVLGSSVRLDDDEFMTPIFQADLMKPGMRLGDEWYSLREMKRIKQFIIEFEQKYDV